MTRFQLRAAHRTPCKTIHPFSLAGVGQVSLWRRAGQDEVDSVDAVFLPESAIDESEVDELEALLESQGVGMVVAGVRQVVCLSQKPEQETSLNETKMIAAILTMAASAREPRAPSTEVGKEYWRKVIENYEQILAELSKSASG